MNEATTWMAGAYPKLKFEGFKSESASHFDYDPGRAQIAGQWAKAYHDLAQGYPNVAASIGKINVEHIAKSSTLARAYDYNKYGSRMIGYDPSVKGNRIGFNSKYFNNPNEFKSDAANCDAQGWWSPGSGKQENFAGNILTHEFGHQVHFMLEKNSATKCKNGGRRMATARAA